jgi:hypothetical protein
MDKWEYLSFRVPSDMKRVKIEGQKYPVPEYLNYLGEQGWELVNAAPHQSAGFQLFFKKAKTH